MVPLDRTLPDPSGQDDGGPMTLNQQLEEWDTLTLALRTALSGLSATQTALQATSHNITNVNTEGYSRKDVKLRQHRERHRRRG